MLENNYHENFDAVVMRSFEFWATLVDHELRDEMYGIGIIYGIHSSEFDQIHEELKDYIREIIEDFPPNCTINGMAKNVTYEEGQMSFPETGQWDFPPHYDMDISVVKVEDLNGVRLDYNPTGRE